MADIIHCDNCGAICMYYENFCSWCGRDRIAFAWQPVPLNSDAWWRREEMRGSVQKDTGLTVSCCDHCHSLLNMETDKFCGFCGKSVNAEGGAV